MELGRVVIRLDSIESWKGRKTISFLEREIGLLMPTPPQTVGIIGSVKNPSTVVYRPSLGLNDYLRQAGGYDGRCQQERNVCDASQWNDRLFLSSGQGNPSRGYDCGAAENRSAYLRNWRLWQTVASIIGSVALTAAGIAVVGR